MFFRVIGKSWNFEQHRENWIYNTCGCDLIPLKGGKSSSGHWFQHVFRYCPQWKRQLWYTWHFICIWSGKFLFCEGNKNWYLDNHDCNVGRDQGPQQSTLDRIDIRQHLHRLILDQRLNRHSATGRRYIKCWLSIDGNSDWALIEIILDRRSTEGNTRPRMPSLLIIS